jgi:tape measure domain-containing protein
MANQVTFTLALEGAQLVSGGFDKISGSIDRAGQSADRSTLGSDRLSAALGKVAHYGLAGGGIVALATSVQNVGTALFTASVNAQRLQTQLNFATGGNSAKELEFVTGVANKLGLELNTTAQAYAGFASAARGTSLEGTQTRKVFESIAQASAVMGLSSDQAGGALLAIQQMMSKGVVSAEEFRGQLGERMPIALQAGANALGVTTAEFSKMLESGQIIAADFLPKFAVAIKEMLGDSVESAANRLEAATARMGTAWERFKRTVGDAGVSQSIANEAEGLGNYFNGVSDAMDRAKQSGSGFLGEMNAGMAQVIGRMPFDVLSVSANTLNGTINLLTGGALGLRTNLNLLPAAFQTNEQRARQLDSNLLAAEAALSKLQARLQQAPDNIYLKSETYQAYLYAQELRAAKKAKDDLAGGGAGRGSINPQSIEQMGAAQNKLAEAMGKYATKGEQATKVIEELRKTHGALFTPEMEKRVLDQLAPEKTGAGITDAQKGLALYGDLMAQDSKLTANFAEEWGLLNAALKGGKINVDQLTQSQAKLLEKQTFSKDASKAWEEQTKASNKAVADSIKEYEKYVDGLQKSAASVDKQVQKLQDEEKALVIAETLHISLAQAIEEVTIARLDEQIQVEKGNGNQEAIDALDAEIKSRRTLMGLMGNKEARDAQGQAGKDAAQAVQAEWKKGWEETDRLARDAFTSWAENGTSMADAIGKSLKKALLSAIYEATLKPIAFNLYTSIMGGAPGGTVGALGQIGNASSGMNALVGAGGLFGSSAAYGAAIGTTSIGAGSQAAMLAAQTGTFGIEGAALTASAAGSTGTAAAMGGLSSVATAVPYIAAAYAVISMLKGGDYVKSLGASDTTFSANGATSTKAQDYANPYGGGLNSGFGNADANKVTAGMYGDYKKIAAALGAKVGDVRFSYGSNDSDGGRTSIGGGTFNSGEFKTSPEAMNLAASRAVFSALQGSELPGYLKTVFDGVTAGTATQAQINDTLAYATSLKTVREAMLETREPVQILKDTVDTGFADLKTSAATFKTDFVAAIDAGISPDNLAKWDGLRVAMDNLANSASNASALVGNIASALAGAQQDYADANRTAYDLLNQAQTDAAGAASSGGGGGGSSGGSTDNGLADAIQYLADTKTGISQWLDKLNTTDAGGLSNQQQATNAWAAFQSQMTLAQGGDRTALDGITGYADTYISAIKSTSKTALDEQLAIAKTKAQVGNLPNSLRPEQFIVEALTGSSSGGGSGGSVVSAIKSLNSKLIADLNVSARSEIVKLITFISNTDKLPDDLKTLALASSDLMTKTVSFITGSKLSDDNKALALATNTDLTKTVNYALGLDIPNDYKELALKTSDSIEKTISFTARNMLDPNQATLALMTDATIVKTIGAAAGHMDKSAMVVALAQSETVRKMIEASGGILTADQATLLNNVTAYNKQINLQINLDPGAVTAAQAYMQAAFGTINVQTIMSGQTASATAPAIQAQTPAQLLKGFIDDQLKYAQTSGEGAAVANVYGAARTYGFTQGDIATVGGYSTAEVNALFDKYNIPRFAVGTDYVPNDMLAMVHQGEQIVPKAYNPNANGNQPRDNAGIERKLEQLQADARVAQATMAALMSRLVKLNERWDGDGMPAVRSLT